MPAESVSDLGVECCRNSFQELLVSQCPAIEEETGVWRESCHEIDDVQYCFSLMERQVRSGYQGRLQCVSDLPWVEAP